MSQILILMSSILMQTLKPRIYIVTLSLPGAFKEHFYLKYNVFSSLWNWQYVVLNSSFIPSDTTSCGRLDLNHLP